MNRTKEEIVAEIEKIRVGKEKIAEFSFFGENNWEKIDAQIRVLEEDMTMDQISKEFSEDSSIEDSAMAAWDWKEGVDSMESPSQDWQMNP